MPNKNLPLGQYGEQVAQQEYKKAGYKIIAQNEFNRFGKQFGEIDFIAIDRSSIVFVEVKTRTYNRSEHGSGFEAVHAWKQGRLVRAAKLFLQRNPQYQKLTPRIDVCVIEVVALDPVKSEGKKHENGKETLYGVDPVKSSDQKQNNRKGTFYGVDRSVQSVIILSNAVEDVN